MRSNAGMAKRQGDGDLRFALVSAPANALGWLGLSWLGLATTLYTLEIWFVCKYPAYKR